VNTINLGEGGCATHWPAALPPVGEVLQVRLGGGFLAPRAEAVVCWGLEAGAERSVGLKIHAEGRAARAWKALVAEVAQSGARPA
jgi:hypothetical protein